ncbi:MAG: hypothetical protein HPY54_04090 [Chthonomonadetes bacterium]|nr:hypothetical protein [Chthonomonadetes bacterium]
MLSWIYALWVAAGLSPQVGAIITSAVSLGAVVWIAGLWLRELFSVSNRIWIGGLLAVLLCRPLLWYGPYALSEAPFMALVLSALWNSWRYTHTQQPRFLIWSVLLSALSPLMRYIGVSVVVAGGVFLLWGLSVPLHQRFAIASGYVMLGLFPLALWALRNHAVSGTFFGVREPSDYNLRQMVFETLWSWHRWVFPVAFENSVSLFGIVLLLLAGTAWLALYRSRRILTQSPALYSALCVAGVFVLSYSLLFVATASGVKFEGFSERLWLPISIPVVLIGAIVYRLGVSERSWMSRTALVGITALWLGWLCSGALMAASTVQQALSHQLGVFSTAQWHSSETAGYLRQHRLAGKVFSNFPEPLFYLTGVVAQQTPHKGPMRVASETFPRNLPQFLQVVRQHLERGEQVYIVWYNDPSRSGYMYTMGELNQYLVLRDVQRLSDGQVYQVTGVL